MPKHFTFRDGVVMTPKVITSKQDVSRQEERQS